MPRTLRSETLLALSVGLPPLILAGFGAFHPAGLDAASASWWRTMHVLLLPLFPLLGAGPYLLVRPFGSRWLTVATAVLGYIYGAFYTALDVLAGIGAGRLELLGMHAPAGPLFDEANGLAEIGVDAYLAATVLAAAAALRRARVKAVPGASLVIAGALSFRTSHIFPPRGVFTMLLLAVGWVALAFAIARKSAATRDSVARA